MTLAPELEAKFLNIDRDVLRQKLVAAGFVCRQPHYLMRRVVFDIPTDGAYAWARVRDEGGVITASYKRTRDGGRIDGTDEIQITVDSFDNACRLFEAVGLASKSYQETWRELWVRDGAEVTLDEWPCIAPFTEIEAKDEAAIKAIAAELGFDWSQAVFGAVGALYEMVGISAKDINRHPRVTFDNVEDVMKLKRA